MYPTRQLLNMHPLTWASDHPWSVLSFIGLYAGFVLLQKAQALQDVGNPDELRLKAIAFAGFFLVLGSLALMMHELLLAH